jgi:hypothetical protein
LEVRRKNVLISFLFPHIDSQDLFPWIGFPVRIIGKAVKVALFTTKFHALKTCTEVEILLHAFVTLAADGDSFALPCCPGKMSP